MKRSERVDGMVTFVETRKEPLSEYDLINAYAYELGIATRTVEEYFKILRSVGKLEVFRQTEGSYTRFVRVPQ